MVPAGSEAVANVAFALESSVPVPSRTWVPPGVPEKKLTLPVGVAGPDAFVTVAVRRTDVPRIEGFGADTSAVDVPYFTTWFSTDAVEPLKLPRSWRIPR